MPKPAPARFDTYDRYTLRTSALTALGPLSALVVLLAGYSLSAHICQALSWTWIAGVVALGFAGCSGVLLRLVRSPRRSEASLRFLVWMGIGLGAFSVCVLIAFAVALGTEVRCE